MPWDDELLEEFQPQVQQGYVYTQGGYTQIVQPGAQLWVDEEARKEQEKKYREKLLDGLELRDSADRNHQKYKPISCARTLLFGVMLAGATVGIYFTHDDDVADRLQVSPLELYFNPCPADGNLRLVGKDTNNADGIEAVVGMKEHKVLRFFPYQSESEAPSNLALESLWYYESEEMKALPREHSYGFSLMMFGNRALLINIEIGRDISCLPQGDREDQVKARNDAAENLLGAEIVEQLARAGRRTPQANIPLVPQVHGAMLLQNRDETMWSVAKGKFDPDQVYKQSPAMQAYRVICPTLMVVSTIMAFVMLGRIALNVWWQSTEVWVVQYDFLWENEDLRSFAIREDGASRSGFNQGAMMDMMMKRRKGEGKKWWTLYHTCGVFFVLDHAIGNPAINDEQWVRGILSTIVQAGSMIALAVLPILHGRFFRDFQILAYGLTAAHFLQCFGFSACYYFGFGIPKRQGFYYGYLSTAFACLFYTVTYLSGIGLFLLTRAVIMPQEAAAVVGTIGGVVAYTVVLAVGLRTQRHNLNTELARQLSEKPGLEGKLGKRGWMQKKRQAAGLDVKTIWANVIGGTVVLSLLGSMFVLVSQLYFDRDGGSQFIASGVTAGIGIFMLAKQLQGSDEASRVQTTGVEAD